MIHRPGAYELIAGVTTDADLRPGDPVRPRRHRGRDHRATSRSNCRRSTPRWRARRSSAPASPRCCKGYRDRPAADIDGVVNVLMQLSRIVADHAEVTELDINPLLCDAARRDRGRRPHPRARDDRLGAGAPGHPALSAALRERDPHRRGQTYRRAPDPPEDEPALRRFADEVDDRDLWHAFFAPLRDAHARDRGALEPDRLRPRDDAGRLGRRAASRGWRARPPIPTSRAAECAVIIRARSAREGPGDAAAAGDAARDRGAGRRAMPCWCSRRRWSGCWP